MGRRFILIVIALFAIVPQSGAQSWGTNAWLNELSNASVKSLNEFIHRFNGDETHPGITDGTNARQKNIVSLFDLQNLPDLESDAATRVMQFAESACHNQSILDLRKPGIYAEAHCLFKQKGKAVEINLVLVYEHIRDDYYRWAIAGVNGVEAIVSIDTARSGYLNPVQHEVYFSELGRAFPEMTPYFASDLAADQLSVLLGLVGSGTLKFDGCQNVTYHVLQVPNYIFTIDNYARRDMNSGWLIHDLHEVPDTYKPQYEKALLGK